MDIEKENWEKEFDGMYEAELLNKYGSVFKERMRSFIKERLASHDQALVEKGKALRLSMEDSKWDAGYNAGIHDILELIKNNKTDI